MKIQAPISNHVLRHNSGQATLSFIILVSGLILEIAIAGSFVTYFLSSSGLGERLYVRALTVAQSSIRDVQIHIVRDKDFGASTLSYPFSLNGDTSNVTVSRVTSGSSYIYSVTAIGVAGTRQRKFVAIIAADQITGLADLQSLSEQTIQ
ncbi:MAG: hypothetical protein WCW78_01490 [Candidatus Paceibacterota bacterium]|jgi:hypothetical protein